MKPVERRIPCPAIVASLLVLLVGCGEMEQADVPGTTGQDCCTVTLSVTVPEGTGEAYLTGNLSELGPWQPDSYALSGEGLVRTAQLQVSPGTVFEYKFTLGSWDREMLSPSGTVMANYSLEVDGNEYARHEIAAFEADPVVYLTDWQESGVLGRLVYWQDVESQFLALKRHVGVWLPPGYDDNPDRRYPVLYMHDGQNLFDPRLANTGVDWGVDEAIVALVTSGEIDPVIVVSAWNTANRVREYSPWHDAPGYARFLIEELKPRVDTQFRTLTGPRHTMAMGSSMGGLLSFYLVTHHPEVFGGCGCISTHFPLSEAMVAGYFEQGAGTARPDKTPYIERDIEAGLLAPAGVRYWFDYGSEGLDARYRSSHEKVRSWLLDQGLSEDADFVVRRYAGADHNEAAWRDRLTDPLRFLFATGD